MDALERRRQDGKERVAIRERPRVSSDKVLRRSLSDVAEVKAMAEGD